MKKNDSTNNTSVNNIKCWNSQDNLENITQRLEEMFVEIGQKKRIEKGQCPAQRAVFRKQHGIAYGEFTIEDDIPENLKKGIFKGKSYKSIIRFSSDTTPNAPDLHQTIGLGLKLFDVKGKKLIGDGTNADFIFQNIDRFFAKDAKQMCDFTTAGVIDGDYQNYINKHKKLADILKAMKKEEASCLSANYWSILPFKLGEEHIVKYRLVPEGIYKGMPFDQINYLKLDLERRLRNDHATFRFEVQLRTNDQTMPIDDAQTVWNTQESPYICIAKLHLPKQDITAIGQSEFGESLSFNIWRTLAEHEPLGSIAHVRKKLYSSSAQVRHQANGQSQNEPKKINPKFQQNIHQNSNCIVRAAIYPPIGVMRVGNSENEYFIGPLTDQPEEKDDIYAYRDKEGAIKRQAAQFRIYGFNAAGKAVKELTMENSKIKWHCHLANQKASWYQFQIALDIPEAMDPEIPASLLRNINIENRSKLLIDGGSQTISEPSLSDGKKFEGTFMDKSVYLGEMRTDQKGRLVMLGGHGKSENINGNMAVTFANNEGWYDDISDGPVTAEVEYEGIQLSVDPAWVICAPPDYAPMQKSVRTMWDLMREVAVQSKMLTRPVRPSFTKDILPIFERMTNLQWVNKGFAGAFGWKGQFNYTTLNWILKLNDSSPCHMEMRRTISNNFRRVDKSGASAPQLWPWLYGDALSIPSMDSVRQHSTLSKLQLEFLDQWVKGDFDSDFDASTYNLKTTKNIDDYPIEQQPDMLTKAAMDFCLADAFHPGCEMTWPMRSSGMYMAPFRLKHASSSTRANHNYYGPVMDNSVLAMRTGPIHGGQVAGSITRWMAIPWQTDTASCRDGYTTSYDPYLPTFWPARVPNNILNEKMYEEVINTKSCEQTRKEAFANRSFWLDDLPLDNKEPTQINQINAMITHFDKLAIVQHREGISDDTNFPKKMQVGITPNQDQKVYLFNKIKPKLKKILPTNTDELETISSNNEDLVYDLYNKLNSLLNNNIENIELNQEVKKLLSILSVEIHKYSKQSTVSYLRLPRNEVGVQERLIRFQRFNIK